MFEPDALRHAVLQALAQKQGQAAETHAPEQAEHGIGIAPYLALAGGEAADIGTTLAAKKRGLVEGNPLLGEFGGKAIAGKVGTAALLALVMNRLAKGGHSTLAKTLGYGAGAGLGAVAAKNATTK